MIATSFCLFSLDLLGALICRLMGIIAVLLDHYEIPSQKSKTRNHCTSHRRSSPSQGKIVIFLVPERIMKLLSEKKNIKAIVTSLMLAPLRFQLCTNLEYFRAVSDPVYSLAVQIPLFLIVGTKQRQIFMYLLTFRGLVDGNLSYGYFI